MLPDKLKKILSTSKANLINLNHFAWTIKLTRIPLFKAHWEKYLEAKWQEQNIFISTVKQQKTYRRQQHLHLRHPVRLIQTHKTSQRNNITTNTIYISRTQYNVNTIVSMCAIGQYNPNEYKGKKSPNKQPLLKQWNKPRWPTGPTFEWEQTARPQAQTTVTDDTLQDKPQLPQI